LDYHKLSFPNFQNSQSPHQSLNTPNQTLSPGLYFFTLEPTLSTIPII